ncbi:fibronectin type III domain-containing protein [Kineosporia sp. A_224]|uniref:fibronectin type III domain-containing protein n=1 Tax=Kineosporia sp. A_224 TaxID=1962180 RepID=UPI000B4ABDB1|nr:fibronectin type III domain-containing protein [Kineosporia sp. A_224]
MRLRAAARALALGPGLVAAASLCLASLTLAAPAQAAASRPSAPRAVTVVPKAASLTVAWARPASTGGAAVLGYKVTTTPGTRSCTTTTALTCTVTGLTNGARYAVRVTARNRVGTGPASLPGYGTPRTTPGAPLAVTVRSGDGHGVVTWAPPASTGGAAVLSYRAVTAGATCTATAPATTCTLAGLPDGVTDVVRVQARNVAGWGTPTGGTAVRPRAAGRLSSTGDTGAGQGGHGVTGLEPQVVTLPRSAWAGVTAGTDHTCAALADGTLWCWGANAHGQLGLGGTTDATSPAQVGSSTDWATVSAGALRTCATQTDHTLWCWGANDLAQLGLGDTTDRDVPVQVGTDTDWASVAAGAGGHTCALKQDSTLYCWGPGSDGRLGTGTSDDQDTPARVGLDSDWASVSVGADHTCGTRTDDTLWCWGTYGDGALGLGAGDTSNRFVPIQVGTGTDWAQVSAGSGFTCARRTTGTLACWGLNADGQLGVGDRTDRTSPTTVGASTGWADVSTGTGWACGQMVAELQCWGTALAAGLGGATSAGPAAPETYAVWTLSSAGWAGIALGAAHGCGLSDGGELLCWGDGTSGRLGRAVAVTAPARVGTSSAWAALSAAGGAACGIRTDGALWCWGETSTHRLPTGGTAPSATPQKMDDSGPWAEVSVGRTSGCGIRTDGGLWCWGSRDEGQVGDGTTSGTAVGPTRVGAATGWAGVSVGATHACATRVDRSLWCWGDNFGNSLGLGPFMDDDDHVAVPTRVGTGTTWSDVSAGDLVTCATKTDRTLWCWGEATPFAGPGLGLDELSGNVSAPTKVGVATTWARVALGTGFGCATRTNGTLWCWGANADGQVGVGDTTDHGAPVQVGSATTWTAVGAGSAHACATRSDGSAWCWGRGASGQLGQGDLLRATVPVHVGDDVATVAAGGGTTYLLG